MPQPIVIKRTTTADSSFQLLVSLLDYELWNELKEDQAIYDLYNKVPHIQTALLIYANEGPVACGCFKEYNTDTVEIKRMFVQKTSRVMGLSKKVLQELEQWVSEKGYRYAVLETSIHFATARRLYETSGHNILPNYPPYTRLRESVCRKKELTPFNR